MKHAMIAFAAAVTLLLAGCDSKDTPRTEPEPAELLLYCGAGISPPVDEIIDAFFQECAIKVVPDYAGSEVLLSKIKLAERGDLYMPGDSYYVDRAEKAGIILARSTVSYWVPTILVQKGNPKKIAGLKDLLKPGIKVGLGDPNACAIGRTTWRILEKNGIAPPDLKSNLLFQSLTVNELGMQIQARSLDAVIVWDAMAVYYAGYGDQVPIPPEKNIISTVDIGVLKFTRRRESAEKFAAFLISPTGREIFEKHNYTTAPPR
ncbi:MAG: substrate-binding domain-containing protein [Sedimentisphaerales bacterium]|nr:substrate-binding domain-containing protein [Sedimentisphaerales bacterium]